MNNAKEFNLVNLDFKRKVSQKDIDDCLANEYHVKVISKIQTKYLKKGKMTIDEAKQLSLIGVWQAIATFDGHKSQFITHLQNCVTFTFKSHFRFYRKPSLPILIDVGKKDNIDLKIDLENLKKYKDYALFKDLYYKNKTSKELSQENNVSDTCIYLRVNKFKEKARHILKGY